MATLGKAFVIIQASLRPLKKSLSLARRAVTASMRSISRTIKRASVLIAAALTGAVIAAAKFREQMAFVSTMLDERTMPAMVRFEEAIKRTSVQFGQSTKALSKGLFDILSATIPVEKAVGVLDAASKAAVAGQTDTAVATRVLITAINAYGISADRVSEISDKLFGSVKRGVFEFPELAQSFGNVATTAAQAGLSFEELLAVLAGITRRGIQMSEAVTAVNAGLRSFLKPTDDAQKVAKKYGLVLSSNTLKTDGWVKSMRKLKKASAEEIIQLGQRQRSFKAMAATISDTAGLTEDLRIISEDSAGRTQEAFNKMSATTSFQFRQLKQRVIATFRSLGDPLLKPVGRAFELIRMRLRAAGGWFEDNEDVIENWANFVVSKFDAAATKIEEWFALISGGEARKAFEDMVETIKTQLEIVFQFMKDKMFPVAKELGLVIGQAIVSGVRLGIRSAGEGLRGLSIPSPVPGGVLPVFPQRTSSPDDTVRILMDIRHNTDPERSF